MDNKRNYIIQCTEVRPSGITIVTTIVEYSLLDSFNSYPELTPTQLGGLSDSEYSTRLSDFIDFIGTIDFDTKTQLILDSTYYDPLCVKPLEIINVVVDCLSATITFTIINGVPNYIYGLYTIGNVLVESGTTSYSGVYSFNNVSNGNYYVLVTDSYGDYYPTNIININCEPTTTTTAAPTTTTTTTAVPFNYDYFGVGSTNSNACSNLAGLPMVLYFSGSFGVNTYLYTDSGLTSELLGYTKVAWNGDSQVYNVNSGTGKVTSATGYIC